MTGWKNWHIIGTDLNGRRCPVARVRVPSHLDKAGALRYIRHSDPKYMVVEEIQLESESFRNAF